MKQILIALILIQSSMAAASELLPKLVPWTSRGGSALSQAAREVCQGITYVRCVSAAPAQGVTGAHDWGFHMYRKDNGVFLGTLDRNVMEEVEQDAEAALLTAEKHHPESAWLAKREAEKAQLEYIAAACNAGGVYCVGMASSLQKFKALFEAACSAWTGVCAAKIAEMKRELQERIDAVKAACASSDQECFDTVTNGGEKQARAQRALQKSISGTGGTPVRPGTHRPPFMAALAEGDPLIWYDDSCVHCKIYEGD